MDGLISAAPLEAAGAGTDGPPGAVARGSGAAGMGEGFETGGAFGKFLTSGPAAGVPAVLGGLCSGKEGEGTCGIGFITGWLTGCGKTGGTGMVDAEEPGQGP